MNQIEKVARAIIGPHEPVPASSRYTLDELREVRWRQITSGERSMALREAKAAIAAMPVQAEPAAWMYVRRYDDAWPPSPPRVSLTRWPGGTRDYWDEIPIPSFPTPPAGGSDAE